MEGGGEIANWASLILRLRTRWRWVVEFIPRPIPLSFHPRGKGSWGPRTGLDFSEDRKTYFISRDQTPDFRVSRMFWSRQQVWSKRPAYLISENWQNCESFSNRKKKKLYEWSRLKLLRNLQLLRKIKGDTRGKTKSTLLQISRKNKRNLLHSTERMRTTRSHLLFNSWKVCIRYKAAGVWNWSLTSSTADIESE